MYRRPSQLSRASPAGNLGRQTISEKAQGGLGNNHPPDVDAEDNDDGRHNIGQDMADQDLACGGAHGPGGQKIVILFNTDHSASDDSGGADASGDSQDHNDLGETPSHNGHDGQQEQQPREGHPGVDKALHHQVHFSPKES